MYLTARRGRTERGRAAALVVHVQQPGSVVRNLRFGDSYKARCGAWLVMPAVMAALPAALDRALCRRCFATESHVVTDQGKRLLLAGTGGADPRAETDRKIIVPRHGSTG